MYTSLNEKIKKIVFRSGQKQARILKFWIEEKERLYYPCAVSAQLICAFVFVCADCWFSDDVARVLIKALTSGSKC